MSNSKEGWLKIKLHNHTKWHRRFCIIDWDKSVLFTASKADTRYSDWIQLLSTIIINDFEYSFHNESNNNLNNTTIEIVADNGRTTHYLQAETKKDCDSWLLALKQAAYSRVGGGIFGQSLEDTYKYSRDKNSLVPLIVRQCCDYLLEHGLTFVGLFRVPGKQTAIKELRDLYDRGFSIELKSSYSPATISSLLKNYLQSLPEPIIPTKCFDEFLEIGSRLKYNQTNDLNRLKQLIETNLSNINYATLAYLCLFLKRLTDHVQTTKMDSDNLAVVFGSNLIRPAEELDLYMFKGHSYSLLPLIKVLIDQSEYLFSNNSINHLQDSYEHTNESITKSSGFSSFSSLLSSNDHLVSSKSRSASMPSLYITTSSSCDSDNQLEVDESKRRRKQSIGKSEILKSAPMNSNNQTSFEVNQNHCENKSDMGQTRFASTDLLNTTNNVQQRIRHYPKSMNNILTRENQILDNTCRPLTVIGAEASVRKMEKYLPRKGFANKFGKSLSSLKSSMSKALQSNTSSNKNEFQTIDSSPLPSNQQIQRKSFDFQSSKQLQNDVDILKELLNKKESLLMELTKRYREECLKFDEEKFQLNQIIQQYKNENIQLKKQLNMQ
ncbi:unnamed protein product [Rotaria magnacalcarata]|uniref:Rho GTPase activating protein n=5 Tax=Rotaria magnacalcarata TaxID=392030 RepID=A0A816ZQ80_9BILA|nr:unnamed protein product [Rotaria magnacalcarata]CAF3768934.1 unnamed protein product [Rotaria magnacalcarata]